MESLPIELIHMICNNLNYFDQINFKSISQWFYYNCVFNRYIPGRVIIRIPKGFEYDYCIKNNLRYAFCKYYIPLQYLKSTIRWNFRTWISECVSLDIYVFRRSNINSRIKGELYTRHSDCKPDFELKAINHQLYFDGKPLNYKLCIQKCADIVRQDMFVNDLIQY